MKLGPFALAPGPLAFPVTPFTSDGSLDLDTFRRHLGWMLAHEPPALFVGCGTGEIASLAPDEVAALVRAALEVSDGTVPVVAGVGHGYPVAVQGLRAAEDAGAHAALVLPPYLVEGEQEGLIAYYRGLAAASDLPLILYQRGTAKFTPGTVAELAQLATVVGLKDGLGEVERIQAIVRRVPDLAYFNGLPTAEAYQPAYAAIGVPLYSSAVFNFVPELSWAFFRAVDRGDTQTVNRLLSEAFLPFTELRNQVRGYAVSLVKAGVALRFGPVGPVRPPLVEVRGAHRERLQRWIDTALTLSE